MLCTYCGQNKPTSDFSREHVLPKGIGGNLMPNNPFVLHDVCRRCNSLAGMFMDGPFIRSWLTRLIYFSEGLRFIDLSREPILPLLYMGPTRFRDDDDRICDFWLGPTGDSIYHFHRPYPSEPDVPPMVGVPTYLRQEQVDSGFVLLFISATNPVWHRTVVRSVQTQFEGAEIYLGNGPASRPFGLRPIPCARRREYEVVRKEAFSENRKREGDVLQGAHFSDRYLAKAALGMGKLHLDPSFETSEDADKLRKFMWTKKPEERSKIPLKGRDFLSQQGDLVSVLGIPGTHLVLIKDSGNGLCLVLILYGTLQAQICISDTASHWKGRIDSEGIVYLIVPGLQKYVGPVGLGTYIAWKSASCAQTQLDKLRDDMSSFSEHPPFDAAKGGRRWVRLQYWWRLFRWLCWRVRLLLFQYVP